jgi:hypothetical protein
MSSDPHREVRILLSLAAGEGLDAAAQARMLAAFPDRYDVTLARERRNAAIREAHRLVRPPPGEPNRRGARSTPAILARDLHEFHARAWPHLRHLAEPPADATPLRRAFFFACKAAADMGGDMPDERQVRRIIL